MNDFKYEIDASEVTVTGYPGAGGDVVVPSTLGGLPVTTIGDRAFHNCTSLASITLSNSVTTIGNLSYLAGLEGVSDRNEARQEWRDRQVEDQQCGAQGG